MEIIFIPPAGLDDRMRVGKMSLVLAQRMKDPKHLALTLELANTRSNYVILDNGAAEAETVSNDLLAATAKATNVDEVVLPDELGNMPATVAAVKMYLGMHSAYGFNYMAVVQGKSFADWQQCVHEYVTYGMIKTIGLPRIMCGLERNARITMASWIREKYGDRFKIHCLGAWPGWVKEAYYVAKYASYVRSLDTSLPYNFAIAGKRVDDKAVTKPISRPLGYFSRNWVGQLDMSLVAHNEGVMLEWMKTAVRDNSSQSSVLGDTHWLNARSAH